MENIKLKSFDGFTLNCYLWDNVKNPKGAVQIIHGMTSHGGRFSDFGNLLNKEGYIAFADDHRAQGQTVKSEDLGRADRKNFENGVKDQLFITSMLKEKYCLPVFLCAHSYGSFLAQRYIEHDSGISGAVLTGSALMDRLTIGRALTAVQCLLFGDKNPDNLLFNMTFRKNNDFFKEGNNAWLSRDSKAVAEYNNDPLCRYVMSNGFYYSLMKGLKKAYSDKELKKIDKNLPIYIMSGDKDAVGGMGQKVTKLYELYNKYGLNVKLKLYKDARHELINDFDKEIIIKEILEFYNSNLEGR